jgi:hypothetical protein
MALVREHLGPTVPKVRELLEPLVTRLGGAADYQNVQQFLADSPWDPRPVVHASQHDPYPIV